MPNFSITPFTSSEAGAWSNSYLVSGRQDALLFDVVQLRNEAGKLADMIGRSGKTLKTVFISHAHPDHFLGSDVLADRFPEARFLTTPNVIGDLEKNGPWMLSLLQDRLGAEGPARLVIPEAVTGNFVELEGSAFEIKEFGEGESAHIATLFVNEPKALLTADVVYNGAHLFLQEKHLESWLDRLDEFEAYAKKLGAVIYPGHGAPGGTELIDRTRGYLLCTSRETWLACDGAAAHAGAISGLPCKAVSNHVQYSHLFRACCILTGTGHRAASQFAPKIDKSFTKGILSRSDCKAVVASSLALAREQRGGIKSGL